ncbi:Inorganic pyrophosphatase [Rickettsiales endosymbiont of Paramecium tredecaurelia]|uniref:inorganic diphosphatase n=1 Tax=Candidatus Sarmatiella mevalonica TaxID=2770581 RepID=UPI001920D867|nr:inorganic diphosphatase [Candidatus Sarmatiella mevalonica]MBL3284759.1 Inorganic pyrophosphatase [Candidatus Sarmatiella mevalonica]
MKLEQIVHDFDNNEAQILVEISMNSQPVKYEFDKEVGALRVDRFLNVAMRYPYNYGFLPGTLGQDGDPLDALLISNHEVVAGALVKTKIVGMMVMEDESGMDEKLILVPTKKLDPVYDKVNDIDDLCPISKKKIEHFFTHYKDLETGKWVRIKNWEGRERAVELAKKSLI